MGCHGPLTKPPRARGEAPSSFVSGQLQTGPTERDVCSCLRPSSPRSGGAVVASLRTGCHSAQAPHAYARSASPRTSHRCVLGTDRRASEGHVGVPSLRALRPTSTSMAQATRLHLHSINVSRTTRSFRSRGGNELVISTSWSSRCHRHISHRRHPHLRLLILFLMMWTTTSPPCRIVLGSPSRASRESTGAAIRARLICCKRPTQRRRPQLMVQRAPARGHHSQCMQTLSSTAGPDACVKSTRTCKRSST